MAESELRGQDLINDDVFARLSQLDSQLAKIIERFKTIETTARGALSTNQLSSSTQATAKAVNEANVAIKEQERLEKRLVTQKVKAKQAQSDINRELIKQRVETQAINRNQRRQATTTSQAVGAYRRLSAELLIAKERLKDIIIEQGRFSAAAQRQARVVDNLGDQIRQADNAAGDFQRNVGNYRSALGGVIGTLRQLAGAFGAIEVIRFGARFLRDAAAIAREARGVEFAFERLGETGEQAFENVRTQTRGLISDLEIQRGLVQLDNFNISLEESGDLFEFLAVRAAQTGTSIDKLRDSLIEGLSKESKLRIDNLGISVVDLNDELSKTPNFVEAVARIAKREVAEAGNVLDDAANGAERFNASFQNFEVTTGKIFNNIKGLSVVTELFDRFGVSAQISNQALEGNVTTGEFLTSMFRNLTLTGAEENARLLEEIEARNKVTEEIEAQAKAYETLAAATQGPLAQGQARVSEETERFSLFTGQAASTVKQLNTQIEELNKSLLEQNTREGAKFIQDQIAALEKERDAILGVVEAKKSNQAQDQLNILQLEEGSTAQLKQTISELQKAQAETAIGSRQWREYEEAIKRVKDELSNLNTIFSGGIPALQDIDSEELQIFSEVDDFLNTEGIDQGLGQLADKLGVTQASLIDEFESLYDRDYKNFIEYQERKLEAEQIIADQRREITLRSLDVAGDFATAFFDVQSNRVEREIELQNRAFDAIVNGKNASEEQIALAEKKREANEIKLQKEREKRQRRAFLIQQAIEVSKIIIQSATAGASALAPPPVGLGPVFGATLIPGINVNAALAIASVLAQSIPAFFKGKEAGDPYQGFHTVNELPGQREIKIGKDGSIKMYGKGLQMDYSSRGDIIESSPEKFMKNLFDPRTETNRRVMGEVSRRGRFITQGTTSRQDQLFLKGIQESITKGYKKAKTNVIVNVQPPRGERRSFAR